MSEERAKVFVFLLVVVGAIVLAVYLTKAGDPPPPTYSGRSSLLLESYTWSPISSITPTQPLLYFGYGSSGALAAYEPGVGQCLTLPSAQAQWATLPSRGQQPALGDALYTNSVGYGARGVVVSSTGTVWATALPAGDCSSWEQVGQVPLASSPRANAKLPP